MGDETLAQDILDGVADALEEMGAARKFRIVTVPAVDIDDAGATPVETKVDVTVATILFSFNNEYMADANVINGNLMAILSLEDLSSSQIAAIKPGNRLVLFN